MSSRHAITLAIAAAWIAVAAPAMLAQSPADGDPALRRLRALDSLVAVRREAYDAARRAAYPQAPLSRLEESGLAVRAPMEIAEPVREAMRAVMDQAGALGGAALRTRLARRLPTVHLEPWERAYGAIVRLTADTARPRVESRRRTSGRTLQPQDLVPLLATVVEGFALDGADSALTVWTVTRRLPMQQPSAQTWQSAFLDLATSESRSLRRCRSGSADACLTSLGLLDNETAAFDTWYAPADARDVVRAIGYNAPWWRGADGVELVRRCVAARDQDACSTAAAHIPSQHVAAPLGADARQTFAYQVLETGGALAYERLLSTPGSVRDRFSAAAGVPLEQVAARWRERVLEARPRDVQVKPLMLLTTLGWCAVLVGIAAVRRSA